MIKKLILVPLCMIIASSTLAQSVSDTEGKSFDELAQLALEHSKELQAAREAVRQAEARMEQSRLRPNPSLDVSKKTDAIFAGEGDGGFSVALAQPIELGGKRMNRIRVAEVEIEMSKAEVADAERQRVGRLRSAFVQALAASTRLQLFERLDRVNQQTVTVMNVRLRSGDASKLDSRLLLAQTNRLRAERVRTEGQLTELMLEIRTIAGLPPDVALVLKRPFQLVSVHQSEQELLARAFASRPDLKAAHLREALAEAGVDLARSQAVPNVAASVRYARESVVKQFAIGGQRRAFERENVIEVGVSIPLPIFNREQGNIAEAASRSVQATHGREALERRVRQEVVTAFRRYENLRDSLDVWRTGVLNENQESLRIVQLAYNLGELRFIDIVNQQRLLLEAETTFLSTQADLDMAIAELELAVGSPLPR